MCSIESAQAIVEKTSAKSKPLVDENPVTKNEAGKGKPALDRTDFVCDDSILATTGALKQHLDKSKAETEAAQIRVNDLEETIRELKRKHQNSEDQLRNLEQELGKSQKLIKFIEKKSESLKSQEVSRLQDSLEAKNFEIGILKLALETVNIKLQTERKMRFDIADRLKKKNEEATKLSDENAMAKQCLCDSQNRIEASEEQNIATINQIALLKRSLETRNIELENERKLHSKTLEKLGKKDAEAVELSDVLANYKRYLCHVRKRLTTAEQRHEILFKEYGIVEQELCGTKQRLEAAEKQNAETIKEKEIMAEELAQWQRYRRKIGRAAQFGDGIGKENQERTNLELQSAPRPAMSPAASKRQSHESGSIGDSAKRARIDTEKLPETAGAKKAANVASRSFDNVM